MPEKDGDEGKSTKSVVNKRQKQMMGEEGYDIARDMGRVRPSKDKKDATTMPPSKEMKKTQKVNKGPSALDIVKKKYKGQIMNVGKKKVKEELDLTQVAEALGGYIVEGKVEDEKKKADAKFKKDFADPLSRGTVTQKALPIYKAGGPFVPDKTVDARTGKKVKPMERKPYMGKATVPDTSKKKPIPADTGSGDPAEIGKNLMKFGQFSQKLASLRKDVDKSKQGAVDLDTDKFFSNVEKRKQSGFDNLRKAVQTGKTKSGEDAAKIGREGTRDISTMNPDELRRRGIGGDGSGSTEGGAGVEGPKRQDQVVKFSSGARGQFPSGSAETGGEMKKFASRNRTPDKTFSQFTSQVPPKGSAMNPEISGIDFDKEVTAKSVNTKPKKEKVKITRSRKRVDKGFKEPMKSSSSPSFEIPGRTKRTGEPELPKFTNTDNPSFRKKSAVGKAVEKAKEFAKDEPVAALATYDLGKGILGKIYNRLSGFATLPTPRAIRVSAKS